MVMLGNVVPSARSDPQYHGADQPRQSFETRMVSQMEDFTSSRAFRVAGAKAFAEAGITHNDVDHLMIYDAFAHLPIYGLEDLGFIGRGYLIGVSGKQISVRSHDFTLS
jgi:acetyl-CoA acetyltransferase